MSSTDFCSECGVRIAHGMKFCPGCGRNLRGASPGAAGRGEWYRRPEFIVVAAFLLVCVVIWNYPAEGNRVEVAVATSSTPAQTFASLPYSDSRVLMIASQFICPCGQCSDDLASTCDCGMPKGGNEVRAYIANELHNGLTVDAITENVKQRYGHRYFIGAARI